MQQKCQQLVRCALGAVRKAAKDEGVHAPGAIKIALVPCTKEADEMIGGFSAKDDEAVYEFTYALCPELGFAANEPSDYVDVHIKKRESFGGNQTEGVTERVYIWGDFLDLKIRVYGAKEKNRLLAEAAVPAITAFFIEQIDFRTS